MSDSVALNGSTENFDNMNAAEFETRLPDLFSGGTGRVSDDPRFTIFLARNPDCAALVHDLECIADAAKALFEPAEGDDGPAEPSWGRIGTRLSAETPSLDEPSGILE